MKPIDPRHLALLLGTRTEETSDVFKAYLDLVANKTLFESMVGMDGLFGFHIHTAGFGLDEARVENVLELLVRAVDVADLLHTLHDKPRKQKEFLFNLNGASESTQYELVTHRLHEQRGILSNVLHNGRIRMMGIGTCLQAYVISDEALTLPSYIWLGKFMSKARVESQLLQVREQEVSEVSVANLLNPADLPASITQHRYDLINVPPTPLVQHALISGACYRLPDGAWLPRGMRFGV